MAKIWQMHAGLPSVHPFRGPFTGALKAATTFLYHLTKLEHKTTQ